ncbi:MAG: O-methyltransferase [Chloroflexota bacterium]|nr:O-methyltransferase [Chloroflexota bacterium]
MAEANQNLLPLQRDIQSSIIRVFAPEDEGLQAALQAAKEAGLPEIQISPLQGKLLQLLVTICDARNILEIGSLAGYSGIWLARALPAGGRLLTLEVNPAHAEVVRKSFAKAGVSDRTEVRVGKALDILPELDNQAPFDLVFIDADKPPYPQYLDWAVRLTRPGGVIVADNCIRSNKAVSKSDDEGLNGIYEYDQRIANDPRLISLLLPMDDDYTDGFAISVVKR